MIPPSSNFPPSWGMQGLPDYGVGSRVLPAYQPISQNLPVRYTHYAPRPLGKLALIPAPIKRKALFAGLFSAWLFRKKLPGLIQTGLHLGSRLLPNGPARVGALVVAAATTLLLMRRFRPKPVPVLPIADERPPYEAMFTYSDVLQTRKMEASRTRFHLEVQLVNTPGGTAHYDSLLAQIQEQREIEHTIAQKLTCLALAM